MSPADRYETGSFILQTYGHGPLINFLTSSSNCGKCFREFFSGQKLEFLKILFVMQNGIF